VLLDAVDRAIRDRRLLDHPFYTAWTCGDLTIDDLRTYARQYYHWVSAFPTWISAAHSNADDFESRQALLENLIDEERGPRNHPELWLRFSDALGLDRDVVKATAAFPETRQAIATMRRIARERATPAAVAALYAYESQQPEVMRTKREGLRDRYAILDGHDYFVEHETADLVHSAAERQIVERCPDASAEDVRLAVDEALGATYTLLDGIEARRQGR
jgi:pyrroloquinoline-quinone synthase